MRCRDEVNARSHVLDAAPPSKLSLVAAARAGEKLDRLDAEPARRRLREKLGVVEPPPSSRFRSCGHEGDRRIAHPVGVDVSSHQLGHRLAERALSSIFVRRDDAAGFVSERDGADHAVKGDPLRPEAARVTGLHSVH